MDEEERQRQIKEHDEIVADFEKYAFRIIAKAYHSPTGLTTPNKIYVDVHAKDKRITLELIRKWFRENVARTKQVGGPKNSYVAQRPLQ